MTPRDVPTVLVIDEDAVVDVPIQAAREAER
jgi:hypothetical protein